MADTHSTLSYIMDKISQIIKQKKMIHFSEDDFFSRLDIDLVEGNTTSGGVYHDDDNVICPYINVTEHSVNFVSNCEEYLGNIEDVEKILKDRGREDDYGMRRLLTNIARGELLFIEYEDFHNDPEIGDFSISDQEEYLACLMCHEMTHCLQFWNCEPGYNKEDVHDLHNEVWKRDYRILRRAFGLVRR